MLPPHPPARGPPGLPAGVTPSEKGGHWFLFHPIYTIPQVHEFMCFFHGRVRPHSHKLVYKYIYIYKTPLRSIKYGQYSLTLEGKITRHLGKLVTHFSPPEAPQRSPLAFCWSLIYSNPSKKKKSRFAEMGVPQNEWFIMENPIKMDDLGVPPF